MVFTIPRLPSINTNFGITVSFVMGIVARMSLSTHVCSAACAASSDAPGRSRAIISTHHIVLLSNSDPLCIGESIGCTINGTKISGETCVFAAPVKPG
jgi:hypothetical protein